MLGIVVATVVFTVVAASTDLGDPGNPSALASWIKLILGVLLVALAVRDLRAKPAADGKPALPKWMSAIEAMTPPRAAGLGFLLAAVNPKNLAMCVAAGVAIAGGSLSGGGTAVAVAVFTVLAGCTVAVPVLRVRGGRGPDAWAARPAPRLAGTAQQRGDGCPAARPRRGVGG